MVKQSPDSVEGHHPSLSSLGHGFKSHSGRSEGKKELCFNCGVEEAVVKHHVPPRRFNENKKWRSMFWDEREQFTIPVCRACHEILDDETLAHDTMIAQYEWVAEKLRG